METIEKVNLADLKAVPFKMNKSLMPIADYAKRESLSIGMVQRCAKAGLLQIRKCKDDIFVVDVPLESFGPRQQVLQSVIDKTPLPQPAKKPMAAPVAKKKTPPAKPVAKKPVVKQNTTANNTTSAKAKPKTAPQKNFTYKAAEQAIAKKQIQIKNTKPLTPQYDDDEPINIDEIINSEILSNADQQLKTKPVKTNMVPQDVHLADEIDLDEIDELISEKDFLLNPQTTAYTKKNKNYPQPQKNWTTAAIISALCLSFSLMCCFWLYLDGQIQRDKISSLKMENVKFQKGITKTNTQIAGIRDQFVGANKQISDLNQQVSDLKKELATTKEQLKLKTQQLEQLTQNATK